MGCALKYLARDRALEENSVRMLPTAPPVIVSTGVVPMMPAPAPSAYRSHSVEREEWPG